MEHRIVDISLGYQHWLALDDAGLVYGLGKNNRYQLGEFVKEVTENTNDAEPFLLAQHIPFDEPIVQMKAGKFHSLFLTESGKLYSVGSNLHGQTGFSNTIYDRIKNPTMINTDGIEIVKIDWGNHHSLVLDSEGNLYGFGSKLWGQIDGELDSIRREQCNLVQIKLPSDSKVVDFKANNVKSCAFLENGEVWFWGGFFYRSNNRARIDGFNLLNEEDGIPNDHRIVDYCMGFGHETVMTEKNDDVLDI